MLQKLYNTHGIISDFRNLVSAGYMYKLAEMGAAFSFTGVNGLFYLTSKELRADRLESVIGTVGDKIVASMYGAISSRSHYVNQDMRLCDSYSNELLHNPSEVDSFIEERRNKVRGYLA